MAVAAAPFARQRAIRAGAAGDTRVVVRLLGVMLFASIFLQRFAVPGSGGLALSMFVTLAALAALLLRGSLRVDPVAAALFAALGCCVSLSVAANTRDSSIGSAMLMLVFYAPFALTLRQPEDVFPACMRLFQRMVLICAVLGIAQYLAQFIVHGPGLFSFDGVVPKDLLVPEYHTVNPLRWGSTTYKSNGFFFLEPSTFSQYLSLAILFEILFFGATARIIVFGVALLLTYSGTGPLMLALLLPCVLLYRRSYRLVIGLAILGGLALTCGQLWDMNIFLGRFAEFGEQGSSATARFLAGAWLIGDTMRWVPHDLLFGLGPGTFRQFAGMAGFEAHDATWAKLIFEYGPIGTVVFWSLFGRTLFYRAPSGWVSIALSVGFLFFGGMLLDTRLNTLILVLCVLPRRAEVDPGVVRRAESTPSLRLDRATAPAYAAMQRRSS